MFINSDSKICITGEYYEFIALSQKMSEVVTTENMRPALPESVIYYLWGYPFARAMQRVVKATTKVNLLFSDNQPEIKCKFPIDEAYSILLCCLPNSEDNNFLRSITSKIHKALPMAEQKSIIKFLE